MNCKSPDTINCREEKMTCKGCYYEPTADEMFEELGYEKTKTHINQIIRYKKDDDNIIYFNENKTFVKSGEYDAMCDEFTMQELQAINKKVEELGWTKN